MGWILCAAVCQLSATAPFFQQQQTIWPTQQPTVLAQQPTVFAQQPTVLPQQPTLQAAPSRQQKWRQQKAAKEDKERQERGEPPIKRHTKVGQYRYLCSKCGKQKNAETGHTQLRGKWYCPSSGITLEEWRSQL